MPRTRARQRAPLVLARKHLRPDLAHIAEAARSEDAASAATHLTDGCRTRSQTVTSGPSQPEGFDAPRSPIRHHLRARNAHRLRGRAIAKKFCTGCKGRRRRDQCSVCAARSGFDALRERSFACTRRQDRSGAERNHRCARRHARSGHELQRSARLRAATFRRCVRSPSPAIDRKPGRSGVRRRNQWRHARCGGGGRRELAGGRRGARARSFDHVAQRPRAQRHHRA